MATVGERGAEVGEALAMSDRDARAARLFVIATRLAAAGGDDALRESRALLERAAADGSPYAALELGIMMAAGSGGAADPEGGLAWVVRAAEAGLATAAVLLGGTLIGRAEHAAAGIPWLRRAAAAEEWSALWLLGAAYLRGLGVTRDAAQARMLFQTAAQNGVVEAQVELAAMYGAGVGGARDEQSAARWERAAADAGHPGACMRVADRTMAQPGRAALALPWLLRAAEAGSAAAAERLAVLYSDGRELSRDEDAAAHWRARADELRLR
ncbi:MAG: hcpC 1 [Myxococcales bacterium]|nr:hcpC 1 [Myxococcales bacterium]